eukprot:8700200-Pyramimonas_sp.AAC.1
MMLASGSMSVARPCSGAYVARVGGRGVRGWTNGGRARTVVTRAEEKRGFCSCCTPLGLNRRP